MTHPALPRIESGLAAIQSSLLAGDLETMHARLVDVLDALEEITRSGLIPKQERTVAPWAEPEARALVWQLLAAFKAADCHVFPYAGTLLGLVRDARLLPNDKDIDLAVWLEDFALAGRLLLQWGLQRATDVPPFANVATYVEPRSGTSVDLFGLRRDPMRGRVEGGVWLYGKPPSHQRLLALPWFELAPRDGPAGTAWWPADPDALLGALYGAAWRTPQPEWDSLVSNTSLQELNLSWRCWALKNLCQCWLTGDLPRTHRLLAQITARAGDDAQLRRWREALEGPRA
ncbi:MAG: cytidyltransferase [Ramlibacter sp.]|jgi:hypothetical protein|nr:cytidyltransferase [Ramlibacter sp.]